MAELLKEPTNIGIEVLNYVYDIVLIDGDKYEDSFFQLGLWIIVTSVACSLEAVACIPKKQS